MSFDGQQGEVAAQDGPCLGFGHLVGKRGGGGVDAGHDGRAGVVFGAGGQGVGVHVGDAVQPVEGVDVGGGGAVGR